MSTPARAFLLLKSDRGEINRVFYPPVEWANTQQRRRSLARPPSPVLPVQVFFPPSPSPSRDPLCSLPSSRYPSLPLALSLFTSSSTAARATSFSRCFRSNMACAHVQSHVQIFTQPLLGRVQDSEGTTAKKETSKPQLFRPVKSVDVACFWSVSATFLFWAPGSWWRRVPGTPQVLVPICPGDQSEAGTKVAVWGLVYWTGGPNVAAEISPGNIIFKRLFPVLFWPLTPVLLVPHSEWCHRTADQVRASTRLSFDSKLKPNKRLFVNTNHWIEEKQLFSISSCFNLKSVDSF